jgi:peptidoglycan/LPS O-acetylase OafA/YrhL
LNIKFVTKPNVLLLVVCVVLLVSIFLPWWSVSAFGFSVSSNGFHSGGVLTFIMSLVGGVLAFLEIPNARYRVLAIGGAGVLALLGVIIGMTDLGGGAGMGFGMIIALIASAALIVVGFLEGRKINMFKTGGSQPPASPPPAPPAPPKP